MLYLHLWSRSPRPTVKRLLQRLDRQSHLVPALVQSRVVGHDLIDRGMQRFPGCLQLLQARLCLVVRESERRDYVLHELTITGNIGFGWRRRGRRRRAVKEGLVLLLEVPFG